MKCESGMDVININFIGNNIDPASLLNINMNIFDRKNNEGLEFLIIIRLFMSIYNEFESEITFVTSIDSYLDQNSFVNYFNNNNPLSSQFTMNWSIYYKIINPLDYLEVKIFGKCPNPGEVFLPTNNNQGNCLTNCGTGYYQDSNKICQKCSLNCNSCIEDECTECKNSHILFNGECFSNNEICTNIVNCTNCDPLDNNQCSECNPNYVLLNNTCLQNNNNCLIFDSNCTSCDNIILMIQFVHLALLIIQ